MARSVASMAKATNWHCQDITVTVDNQAYLSIKHLNIPPPLSCKLAAHFFGLFPIFRTMGPVFFCYNY